jgi:polysaccharide deacetylase family protein (PEP-CTERM system associated)
MMTEFYGNIMTIDVEDWYHSSLDIFKDSTVKHGEKPDQSVVGNTLKTLDILDETGNQATFFVLGTVAQYYPDVVREIKQRGHEVGCHGYGHNLVYKLSPQEFEDDLKKSLDYLDKAGCSDVCGYRAPYWSITKNSLWALDILQKLNFKYDSSIFPIRRGLYGIPDADPKVHRIQNDFWEFPPATMRVAGVNLPFAGGGYLRLFPYFIIDWAIKKSRNNRIRIFYFHPYELDPSDVQVQHQIKSLGSLAYWFQQKLGRKGNPEKLKKLISEHKFSSIFL